LKKIEVIVNHEQASRVERVFNELGLLYFSSEVKINYKIQAYYSASLPDEFSEKVMEKISEELNLEKKENFVMISEIEGFSSKYLEELEEKAGKEGSTPFPTEALVERTDRYTHLTKDIVALTLLTTLVALAGLLLDNVVILIGAMILAPLIGPITALAVNTNLGRPKKLLHSQTTVLALLAMTVVLSALTTFIINQFVTVPESTIQIAIRTHVSILDVFIALVIGSAAGLAFRVELPEYLFGVAIAAALIPPAAVAGIELAFLNHASFVNALLLMLVYTFGLEFGCTLTLRIMGVSPRNFFEKKEARKPTVYSITFLAVLLAVLIIIILLSPLGSTS
jgi:uncharacterized hydrophobic protein (TIGR00341 family)